MTNYKYMVANASVKATKSIGARVTEDQYDQILKFAQESGMNTNDWLKMLIKRHEYYSKLKPIIISALEFKIRNTTIGINTLSQRKEMQKVVDILNRI